MIIFKTFFLTGCTLHSTLPRSHTDKFHVFDNDKFLHSLIRMRQYVNYFIDTDVKSSPLSSIICK